MNFTFNERIEALKPSASVQQTEKAKRMIAEGVRVVNLAAGEPDFDTPAIITQKAIEQLCLGKTHYTLGLGIAPLRERIARHLNEEFHIACGKENILVTPGAKCGIYLAVQALINEGDEVMYLAPGWVTYAPIACTAGATPVAVDLPYETNYTVTRELLERHVSPKTRMLIINNPCNPTGRVFTKEELEAIAAFIKAHDIVAISDEIYCSLLYDGHKHISLASFPEVAEQVITVNGFSKSYAMTGWRLAYMCMHPDILKRIMKLYQHSITCLSVFSQEAAVVALDCGEQVEKMRQVFAERRSFFIGELNKIKGIDARYPEGTFYAWAKFDKDGMDSFAVSNMLLEKALVATVPGEAYGVTGAGCVRFSFASSMSELARAVENIRKVMEA